MTGFAAAASLLILALAAGSTPSADAAPSPSTDEPLVVFLVRHAEKTAGRRDPPLSAAGRARSAALAAALRSAALEHVHSSNTKRTRQTAAGAAAQAGVAVQPYDPLDLPSLAATLLATGGRHLVVGHSNTTPHLVALLGGDPVSPIDEAGEYDRLYTVVVGADGVTTSVLLRYGEPFRAGALRAGAFRTGQDE